MSNLDKYLKGLILIVWGASITLRILDIKETLVGGPDGALVPFTHNVPPGRVDVLAIIMSLIIVGYAVAMIGRARRAWLTLTIAIIISKIITVAADARVGDLAAGDLAVTSLVTFLPSAVVLLLLIRSRYLLEAEVSGRRR